MKHLELEDILGTILMLLGVGTMCLAFTALIIIIGKFIYGQIM